MRTLNMKFVYAARDIERMDDIVHSLAQKILGPDTTADYGGLMSHTSLIETRFREKTSLPLSEAFSIIQDNLPASEDVVMTTISIKDIDLITVTHRNAIKPKALELAS